MFLVTRSVCWRMNKSWFFVVCRDMFLSTVEVILLLLYFFDHIVFGKASFCWLSNKLIFIAVCQSKVCAVCCDMFLSTSTVLHLIIHFFYPIVLETPLVWGLRNQSRIFVQIFDYIEDLWQFFLNKTDQKWVRVCQNRVKIFWVYFCEIVSRKEAYWMLFWIMLWNW